MDAPSAPTLGYAICTIGRSGATWFGELLTGTGVLGRPREYFNTPSQRDRYGADYPTDRAAQVRLILTEGATPNGVYGLKAFPRHLRFALDHIRWSTLPGLHFIHWTRRDVLGQALSRQRASHTLQWRSTDRADRPPPPYDGEGILNAMRWGVVQNARWDLFFARNGVAPLRLVYEDVMADPQAAVGAVAGLLGLDAPRLGPNTGALEIQRDDLTETWRARFHADYGDVDTMDLLDVAEIARPEVVTSGGRHPRRG